MTLLTHLPVNPTLAVSAAVYMLLLAALAQLPVLGQILVPVLLVHSAATWLHSIATRHRPRAVPIGRA